MALLEPITFQPSSPKQRSPFPMAPAAAPAPEPTPTSNPSFRSVKPELLPAQPHLNITPGIGSPSRSDPPTPLRGPPPTPKGRPQNELSKADPPTPLRDPPPTPRRREVSFGALSSLSLPSPPSPPSPRPPPSTPTGTRRALTRGLPKHDPTLPGAPPPSSQRRRAGIYPGYSRSSPPIPPGGPPPMPGRPVPWTTQEINLLVSVCKSGVELGWCQIAGLFHGRSVLECRNKFQDVTHGEREAIELEDGCYAYDCEHSWDGEVFDDNSRNISRKCLSIPTEAEDPVPELIVSNGPSPVGSPVVDRRVTTKRSWGQIGDVETADEGTIHHHSYGKNSSDKPYSSKKAKTITHLSDELNFVLSQQWSSNIMDRIQEHHAMSQHAGEKHWSPCTAPGFELVQVSSVLGNQS